MRLHRGTGHADGLGARPLYYGWVLVLTLSVTETISYGVLYYSFSVFLAPMRESTGWSLTAMTGAFSVAQLLNGAAALLAGRWLDRHGPRVLMTVGSVLASVLVLAWAAATNLVVFYLVWAALGVTMAAVLYEPAFVVVANWFVRRRGRALTVLTFIAGFASVIFIPLTGFLVDRQGWRGALVTLAAILAAGTILPHALLLRRRPEDMGLWPDGEASSRFKVQGSTASDAADKSDAAPIYDDAADPPLPGVDRTTGMATRAAVRGVAFRWLTLAFFLISLGQVAIHVHLVPYLTEHGYSAVFAANVAGLVGIMALPGRLIFTPLGDRVSRAWLTAGIFSTQAFALLSLLLIPNAVGVVLFVILFGTGFGAVTPMRAAIVGEFYGRAHYGAISGVLALFLTAARGVGPVSVGAARDSFGSYVPALWAVVALSIVSAVAILLAERNAPARE